MMFQEMNKLSSPPILLQVDKEKAKIIGFQVVLQIRAGRDSLRFRFRINES